MGPPYLELGERKEQHMPSVRILSLSDQISLKRNIMVSVRENNVANSRRSSALTSSYQASSHKASSSSQQQRMTGEPSPSVHCN
jgi:hypothetical protein